MKIRVSSEANKNENFLRNLFNLIFILFFTFVNNCDTENDSMCTDCSK